MLDRLLSAFPEPAVVPAGVPTYVLWREDDGEVPFSLSVDEQSVQRVEHPGSMVDWLVMDVTRKAVECADGSVPLHAAVASRHGHAILLPAAPSSGKTTTVAGLARAGLSYLSDEVGLVSLDEDLVHPFARPLVMDPASVAAVEGLAEDLPEAYAAFRGRWYHVAPDDLRPGACGGSAVPSAIVTPRYVRGGSTVARPLSKAETLFALAEHAFDLPRSGQRGMERLRELSLRVPGYELETGDLSEAVAVVVELLR